MQSQAVDQPMVLSPASRPGAANRLRGALIFAPCATILALSVWLIPHKSGHGTHRELGLPPCAFLAETGYPCPSCGMTTAFANMAHGHFVAAFRAQPFGVAMFAVVAVLAAVGLGELLTGRDFVRLLRLGPWWAVAAIVGIFGGWGIKIAWGLASGTLPVR